MAICICIAVPAWFLGKMFSIVGGAIFAILAGMIIALFWTDKKKCTDGIKFTSKYILQLAVVFLGFGMDLGVILRTGARSLPIIICTISIALFLAWALHKIMHIPGNTSILIGVGSSICGGSAIAATAPVIGADDDDVAQSISVIFFFNVVAAILFPILGCILGFSTVDGEPFGIFAGTAINDTSSVTAAASTWDSMWNLGSQTLDEAVTVKLTRTLAIIPITLCLAYLLSKRNRTEGSGFSLRKSFPIFILFFIIASVITTVCISFGMDSSAFSPLKELSKFLIVMAMAAIGLNSNVVKLVRSGGKPLLLGLFCWIGITVVSLIMQKVMGIW